MKKTARRATLPAAAVPSINRAVSDESTLITGSRHGIPPFRGHISLTSADHKSLHSPPRKLWAQMPIAHVIYLRRYELRSNTTQLAEDKMLYRGFKIERVIYHNNVSRIEITHDGGRRIIAHQRIDYVISEAVAGFHWQQIGTADNITIAKQMVDRIATAGESSRETIRIAV